MNRARTLAVAGFTLALAACASVLGVEDPIVDLGLDGSTGDGSADAQVDATGGDVPGQDAGDASMSEGGGDTQAADTGTPDTAVDAGPCPPVAVDEVTGVFVDLNATADASANCGTIASPCKTIQRGLDQARVTTGKTTVYVRNGIYTEQVSLYAGLNVVGGWNVIAPTWTNTCVKGDVTIVAPDTANVTVLASFLTTGTATLSKLTIQSKPSAKVLGGETIYGVFATGSTTTLDLVDVDVTVTKGGTGANGSAAGNGATGQADCLPYNDGNPGAPPGSAGVGADAGVFGLGGYDAGPGATGGGGATGHTGTQPQAPACLSCVSCSGTVTCSVGNGGTSCGTAGHAGCGGGLGGGGAGGASGGSSIALFAFDAHVDVQRGSLNADDGGNGGNGAPPGDGGAGGIGALGMPGNSCPVSCHISGLNCVPLAQGQGVAGTGTNGGKGSGGGGGGGGAGGWSCGTAKAGAANITLGGSTVITRKNSGAGGMGAAPGAPGVGQNQCP